MSDEAMQWLAGLPIEGAMAWSGGWLLRGSLFLVLLVFMAGRLARRSPGRVRHLLWSAGFVAAIALPLASIGLPRWEVVVPAQLLEVTPELELTADGTSPVSAVTPSFPEVEADAEASRTSIPRSGSAGSGSDFRLPSVAARNLSAFTALFFVIWAVGAILLFARLGGSLAGSAGLVRRAEKKTPPTWERTLFDLSDRIGLPEAPRMAISDEVALPMTCGVLAPTILLPRTSCDWSEDRLEAVLCHELAHIRRRDLVTHLLGHVGNALYWVNPFAWKAARQMRSDSEQACDDLVLSLGYRPSTYAEHLLQIATGGHNRTAPLAALPMARPREFEARLLSILAPRGKGTRQRPWHSPALAGGVLALALPFAVLAPRAMAEEAAPPLASAPPVAAQSAMAPSASDSAASANDLSTGHFGPETGAGSMPGTDHDSHSPASASHSHEGASPLQPMAPKFDQDDREWIAMGSLVGLDTIVGAALQLAESQIRTSTELAAEAARASSQVAGEAVRGSSELATGTVRGSSELAAEAVRGSGAIASAALEVAGSPQPGEGLAAFIHRVTTFAGTVAAKAVSAAFTGLELTTNAVEDAGERRAAEGTFTRTLSVSGPLDLEIETGSGGIDIRQGEVDRVEIRGFVRADPRKRNAEELVARILSAPPIRQAGNRVEVVRYEDRELRDGVSISYEIIVPVRSAVQAETGSGRVNIRGIDGDVVAEAGSGTITLSSVRGSMKAETGSGSIRGDQLRGNFEGVTGSGSIELELLGEGDVVLRTGSGSIRTSGVSGALRARTGSGGITASGEMRGPWDLDSGSGSITVTLPADASFVLNARSGSGTVDLAHPVTIRGQIDSRRQSINGTVRNGGHELALQTGSGRITVR